VKAGQTVTCTFVPQQLNRDKLIQILSDSLVKNYEQFHFIVQPL
jgi:hypothetical protein